MGLGPIEVIEVAFPGSEFNGDILPALEDLVERDVISIVDCLLVTKDPDGDIEFVELSEVGSNADVARLAALMGEANGLLSDEDIDELAAGLNPGDSGAVLVFEHTWAKPFRDAIDASGGELVANIRVPGLVVDEVLEALEV